MVEFFSIPSFLHWLDLAGTGVFAVAGAIEGVRKKMDMFGVLVLGTVTAIGGGTLRDMILGCHPIFWTVQIHYLAIAVLMALLTFVVCRRAVIPMQALLYADALGLATFTVIGFEKTLQAGYSYAPAILMGMCTAVGGGMIRDVLARETPLILQREIYATASLFGGVLMALLIHFAVPLQWTILAPLALTLIIRCAAIYWDLGLPVSRQKMT